MRLSVPWRKIWSSTVTGTSLHWIPDNAIALGAPTGKASRRMAETIGMDSAATRHSLLGLHGEDAGWQ